MAETFAWHFFGRNCLCGSWLCQVVLPVTEDQTCLGSKFASCLRDWNSSVHCRLCIVGCSGVVCFDSVLLIVVQLYAL
jgi:hypothetical protein